MDQALRRGGAGAVRLTHLALLGLAAAALAAALPFATLPARTEATFGTALILLGSQLAVPVVVLALTAPAVQVRLLSATGQRGRTMYGLYAASNAGSLAGLLSYPWLIEPTLTISEQWSLWRLGVWTFAVLAALLWLLPIREEARPAGAAPAARPGLTTRLVWVTRAAVPAALLAGVTEYATRDIAPIPLLWVVPLALYLVTWIVGFGTRTRRVVEAVSRFQDVAAILALVLFLNQPFVLVGPLVVLLALVVVGITQHGALAESAPPAEWLGRFYVLLAVGGAAGTALVVLAGPTLSPLPIETGVALVAAVAMGRPARTIWTSGGQRRFLLLALVAVAIPFINGASRTALLGGLAIAAGVVAIRWRALPLRVAAVMTGLLVADSTVRLSDPHRIASSHSVLGRFTVSRGSKGTQLVSGSTLHGLEPPGRPDRRPEAALYYARYGPYGDVVGLLNRRGPGWRFGVVGLGIGSLACTAPPTTRVTFFELNPGVLRLARDTTLFLSLTRCAPEAEVRLGDARLTLAESGGRYDLLTLDAFSSDAIPTHLLTREAFALYRDHLATDGVVAFHVSNRFLDLGPVVGALARDAGWVAAEPLAVRREVPAGVSAPEPSAISMVALASDSAILRPLVAGGKWRWLHSNARPWTDDWSPLASALQLSRANLLGQ